LRQLAHADEILRVERADAMDQIVADLRPFQAHALVADVMAHAGSARREDRDIGAALALQLELVLLDAFADFVVGDFQRARVTAAASSSRPPWSAPRKRFKSAGSVV
jgi:hypothetical protein